MEEGTGSKSKIRVDTIPQKQMEYLAKSSGMSVEDYAARKKMAKCDECGNWGLTGFQMYWSNRGEVGEVKWKCRHHTDDTGPKAVTAAKA